MKKLLLSAFILSSALFLFGQSQEDINAARRDIFVILDVSRSMEEQDKFTNVQDYLDRELINGVVKTGDTFTLVTFGDSAGEIFSRRIASDADKTALVSDIRRVKPDNGFTDIGIAMEKLAEILDRNEEAGTRRIILFITDGMNAPPWGSKYRGVDLSIDENFKSLGEKISRGSWFFYIIGIGGNTDAQEIASAVPNSVLQTTGSDMQGIELGSQIGSLEEEERARIEAERIRMEEEERARRMEKLILPAIAGGIIVLILLILLILLFRRVFRIKELIITDEQETLIKRLPAFGGVLLNSPAAILPGIGSENSQIFRLQRSFLGLKVKILDPRAIADNSPYKKNGTHSLRGVIKLANGRVIRVTLR
ncbi:MAG: VWA domain-containing protein [Spirochaetaceae bacterium]|jgi:hypothetical protein|nr:VWA domain-containing protein [Spirochaetaceae bacterium]